MFSPDGNYLFTGARQDEHMFCWDIRYTYESLYTMRRDTGRTNQRIQFDIEPCGKHLITGNGDGSVRMFNLQDGSQVDQQPVAADTVNGAAFHPSLDLLATASGHRRYVEPERDAADTDRREEATRPPARPENSLMVWRLQLQHLQLPVPRDV
ncbi:hypothetical protein GPECTOR_1g177 [Gonium pectorale]|uniref:Uncharacterized protein n=1 Tax=Gonium pectorale TaxID=33097 RepID=A0A150H2B4_GONPE|nr:hypothetical protein GPECTOR_1g177 [Gonium pectorale]|eukprot:KXZ56204.1 hypothetical protein GPECTOR_1g177 [Gonium pectorale]